MFVPVSTEPSYLNRLFPPQVGRVGIPSPPKLESRSSLHQFPPGLDRRRKVQGNVRGLQLHLLPMVRQKFLKVPEGSWIGREEDRKLEEKGRCFRKPSLPQKGQAKVLVGVMPPWFEVDGSPTVLLRLVMLP